MLTWVYKVFPLFYWFLLVSSCFFVLLRVTHWIVSSSVHLLSFTNCYSIYKKVFIVHIYWLLHNCCVLRVFHWFFSCVSKLSCYMLFILILLLIFFVYFCAEDYLTLIVYMMWHKIFCHSISYIPYTLCSFVVKLIFLTFVKTEISFKALLL